MRRLPHSFFARSTDLVARELLGKILWTMSSSCQRTSGRIVETEAYFGYDDPASHAYRGPTPRNHVMFGPAGVAYVYFSYGNHHCFNIVTENEGLAGAVLIRALEPLEGLHLMKRRRGVGEPWALGSGPGKLTQAMGIKLKHNGLSLVTSQFMGTWDDGFIPDPIFATPRIGISKAQDRPYRYVVANSEYLSRKVAPGLR